MPAATAPLPPDPAILANLPAGTRAAPIAFTQLAAWLRDDHQAAFQSFLATCPIVLDGKAALRGARPPPPSLQHACLAAQDLAKMPSVPDRESSRTFFETHFTPVAIEPAGGAGFLTAYFEPEVAASLSKSEDYPVSILNRPDDLVAFAPENAPTGAPAGLVGARRIGDALLPYFDRAEIWAGVLAGRGLEIAWLKDEAELFIIQVQGSARLRLPDGTLLRLVYAGRNGHAYTSIGKILVETGAIPLGEMSLERLMAWLRADPARGRALMEKNRSYIFFRFEPALAADQGPIGGAGVPLVAGRSLAIDRTIWPYGLPVFIETKVKTPDGQAQGLDRLMIAQDTGSAILGPARGDFFMGSGVEAGRRAGLVRDSMRFYALVPHGRMR